MRRLGRLDARRPAHQVLLLVGVLLVPLAAAALLLVLDGDRDYLPEGDLAMIEMRTRDVGSEGVRTGLYSREGWNHPGPALFHLLAAPYRLSGSSSTTLPVVALLVNGASLAGMVAIATRRGGAALGLCTLLGSAVLVRGLGPDLLQDIWNPQVPVLPFGLLVLLVWELVCGGAWALPVAAAVATFAAQVHVGYVALALPLAALGAAGLLVRRRHELRRLALPVAATVGVLAVLWAPPLLDEVRNQPGNLAEIADWFRENGDQGRSLLDGVRVVASQFEAVPEWVAGPRATNPFTAEPQALYTSVVPVLLLPFAAAGWLAWRRRAQGELALVGVVSAALVVGVVSVVRTIGPVLDYRLRWTMVLGANAAVAAAWVACGALGSRAPAALRRAAPVVAVVAVVALSVSSTVAALRLDVPEEELRLRPLVAPVERALADTEGVVLVRTDEGINTFGRGLLLQLERRAFDARVDEGPDDRDALGAHRLHQGEPVGAVVGVVTGERLDARLRSGEPLTAFSGPQTRQERVGLLEQGARLDAAHESGRLGEQEYFEQRAALNERLGRAVGVVVEPPDGGAQPV